MQSIRFLARVCAVIALGAASVSSTTVAQVPATPDSALAEALSRFEGEPLSLAEAIDLAMQNSTVILDAQAALAAARGRTRRERGGFDPEFFSEAATQRDEVPTSSPFSGASVLTNNQSSLLSGFRTRLTTGTELSTSLQAVRASTNSSFAALNPQYTTFAQLTVRQPLLAGGGVAADADLRVARLGESSMEAYLEDAVHTVQAAVVEFYWDLYAAERDLAVQGLIRERAAALLTESQQRARAGLVGPNQVENAKVFLAEQELAEIDRQEALYTISDQLVTLIGASPSAGVARYRPVDSPPMDLQIDDADELVAKAVEANRALDMARRDIDEATVRLRAERRNRLPRVDLVGTLGSNGLSGDARDVIFGSDTLRSASAGNFADALRQVGELEFPRWSVGVDVTIPIGPRRRGGEIDRLRAEVERAEQRYEGSVRVLKEQVRRFHRELVNGKQRLAIARRGVDASQEQVRIGLIEYRNGRSTAFELVRLGADLAAAQQRYSQALVRTVKAAASLSRLTSGVYPFPTQQRSEDQ
jgi:outer membrane protein TolC